jgi:hypothetical protein
MATYTRVEPVFDAIQWTGDNVAECEAFRMEWFPVSPQQPDDPSPQPAFWHDEETQILGISPGGYVVNLGDWLVNGGTWAPGLSWAGAPDVIPDAVFQVTFHATP